ncbi:MAG: HIT family protein [Candidatus Eiseniibacteriota bacterium]
MGGGVVERLWAGWRMSYIAKAQGSSGGSGGSGRSKAKAPCLFCDLAKGRAGLRNLVLAKTPEVLVVMNRYPYNVGHVMVAPRRHLGSIASLTPGEAIEITRWIGRAERALRKAYRPDGFNIGMNLGRAAGAGVLGHLHWHIVPRWNGDTNFMPVTAATKVLPEALDQTYRKLLGALVAGAPKRRRRR